MAISSIVFVLVEWQTRDWRAHQQLIGEISAFGGSDPTIKNDSTVTWITIEGRIASQIPERFSVLETLYCSDSNVTDDDLRFLDGVDEITVLHLDGTQITDAGLPHLSKIGSLNAILFDDTLISDDGMEILASVNFKLGVVLSGTQVTQSGADRLKELRPEIYVIHDELGLDGYE
ncbi:MAG: hypothetical protein AAF802_29700 [Planctomycetota bacterium]